MKTWIYDGGKDVHGAFALSGEPPAVQVTNGYGTEPFTEVTGSEIAAVNVAKREWQKEYMEYWNSTEKSTGTGRPVDAVIAPIAPFAAALPEKFNYYGYSTFVNILDYTSAVIPVTTSDKTIDVVDEGYVPMNEQDRVVWQNCESPLLSFFHLQ